MSEVMPDDDDDDDGGLLMKMSTRRRPRRKVDGEPFRRSDATPQTHYLINRRLAGEGTEGGVEEEEGEREGVLSKRHYTVYALVTELLRVIGAARPLAGCCSAPLINSIINATMCVALLR